jgi:Mg-chelatase subunit ChlD
MVVLCTDGMANKGLGALEGDKFEDFYNGLAVSAKEKGIAISVVTIKGEGCRMDVLGQLAEKSNGNMTRVNPSEIDNDFAEILEDEVVGTGVKL